jgi:predicted nucleotidyltransferase
MDLALTKTVLAALERQQVRYVIFGAVALNLHGLARATEDLDIFVEADRENIHRLQVALASVFDDPHIDEITADDLLGEYPAIQYIPPKGGFHIDILTRLGETWHFSDLDTQRVNLDGLEVSVVTPQTLYAMKKGTVRPKDWGDAAQLREFFDLED